MGNVSKLSHPGWVVGVAFLMTAACGPSGSGGGRPVDPFTPGGSGGGGGAGGAGQDAGFSTDADPFVISFPDALTATDASGSGGGEGTTDALMACGASVFRLERTPPEVLVVLDRSGSMMRTTDGKNPLDPEDMVPAGTPVRWRYTFDALSSVMASTQSNIAWGLKLFPTCTPGAMIYQCLPNSCHTEGGLFLPDIDQAAALTMAMQKNSPRLDTGATPMAPAVAEAAMVLKGRNNNRPKYILLATDGIPNCAVDPVTMTRKDSLADVMGAIESVKAAKASGLDVFVLGIGFMDPTLNQLAQEGGRAREGDTKYYSATDEASLKAALAEIAGATVSCTLPLGREPPAGAQTRVDIDGMLVPESAMEGWSWASASKKAINLNGSYCVKLKNGELDKTIVSFGCPGMPVPPPPVAL